MSEESNRQGKKRVVGVRFQGGGKTYHFDPENCRDLMEGDFVVVDTVRGRQIGEVAYFVEVDEKELSDLKPVLWRATGRDLALHQQWEDKAEQALDLARERAAEMGLEIKLVAAEYTLDGRQLTILYTSGKKEDARVLRKSLRSSIRSRLRLRQIGPRDHARLLGGYGACGEPRCCSRFMTDFVPISIRMGKAQGISLTPSEITGMCGRLRCCLSYEYEMYKEASRGLPRRKKMVKTPYGTGKVVDLLPLRNAVVVQIDGRRVEVAADDIEVLPKE
jgi:cell fate regulator YaaT (PSP1 superfamily)